MIKYCKTCHKRFEIAPSKVKSYKNRKANKNFFCSRECFRKYWIDNIAHKKENHPRWKGGNLKRKCAYCKSEFYPRRKGKDRKYKFCSRKCLHKWLKDRFIKEKNPNWKGSPQRKDRTETLYLNWRRKVAKRDKYKCQICGTKDKPLRAHHIKRYKYFPKLRYDVNNGILLCEDCHKKIHKGNKNKLIIDPVETL